MKKKFYLICMSFDGSYQKEPYFFESIEEAWEYANNLGSKWYFYPFYFVGSGKSIADAPDMLTGLIGKRISTIKKIFKKTSEQKVNIGLDASDYMFAITELLHEKDYLAV
jgi:hypothetical protein